MSMATDMVERIEALQDQISAIYAIERVED